MAKARIKLENNTKFFVPADSQDFEYATSNWSSPEHTQLNIDPQMNWRCVTETDEIDRLKSIMAKSNPPNETTHIKVIPTCRMRNFPNMQYVPMRKKSEPPKQTDTQEFFGLVDSVVPTFDNHFVCESVHIVISPLELQK